MVRIENNNAEMVISAIKEAKMNLTPSIKMANYFPNECPKINGPAYEILEHIAFPNPALNAHTDMYSRSRGLIRTFFSNFGKRPLAKIGEK